VASTGGVKRVTSTTSSANHSVISIVQKVRATAHNCLGVTVCACTVVCTAGVPLKDAGGVATMSCAGNDINCPSSHQCKGNLCCPRARN
jgi:hypothetical protein